MPPKSKQNKNRAERNRSPEPNDKDDEQPVNSPSSEDDEEEEEQADERNRDDDEQILNDFNQGKPADEDSESKSEDTSSGPLLQLEEQVIQTRKRIEHLRALALKTTLKAEDNDAKSKGKSLMDEADELEAMITRIHSTTANSYKSRAHDPTDGYFLKGCPEYDGRGTPEDLMDHLSKLTNFLASRGRLTTEHFKSNLVASLIAHNAFCEHARAPEVQQATTIDEVKQRMTDVFSRAAWRSQLRASYEGCAQKQGEDIVQYGFRFEQLRTSLGDTEMEGAMSRFIDGLKSEEVKKEIRKIRALSDSIPLYEYRHPLTSIKDIANLGASLSAAALDGNRKRKATEVEPVTTAPSAAPEKEVKRNNKDKQNSKEDMWCSYHKSRSHNTADCRAAPKEDKPAEAPKDPKSLTCLNCKRSGHRAEDCWAKGGGKHYAPDQQILATLPHPVVFTELVQEKKAKDQKKIETSISHITADLTGCLDDPPLYVNITVNDNNSAAFVDSGCSRSYMTERKQRELGLRITSNPEQITVESDQPRHSLGVTEPTIVRCGVYLKTVRWTVMDKLQHGDFYLGRPELRHFGMLRTEAPKPSEIANTQLQRKALPLAEEEIEESTRRTDDVHAQDQDRYEEFMKELSPLLDLNQQITGFAKTPEVSLELLDRQPKWIHQYPIAESHKEAVRAQIRKWHDKGKIRTSNSLWNLPLTTADKKDKNGNITGVRVCLDPRSINQKLVPDSFAIPDIKGIYNSFRGCRYFGEIDLEDAFLQLRLKEEDQKVLSFSFEGVQYSFIGAPYGLKMLSSVFQRHMSALLRDLPFVRVYIDNITIASKTWAEHKRHVTILLERLNSLNIKISVKKFLIGRRSLRILGREISESGIKADPAKVAKVLSWPFPNDCKALQSFLGVANYLRDHIRHLAELEAPLNKARVDQKSYDREVACNREAMERSFQLIKEAVAKAPLIRFPDFDRPFHVALDASRVGLGGVLYQPTPQQDEIGDTSVTADNIVAITSRSLTPYEKNYATYKLELLAIVNALHEFRDFIYGVEFHLHTDHRALVYTLESGRTKPLHPTIAGWISDIMEYNFTIEHVPGQTNILPDHLSRLYSHADAWGVPNVLATALREKLEASGNTYTPLQQIPTAHLAPITKSIQRNLEKEELMKALGKTIPEEKVRQAMIEKVHAEGHLGILGTVSKLYNTYHVWWPSMRHDVERVVGHCTACQKYSVRRYGFHPPRSPQAFLPNEWVQLDLLHFPTSVNGYSYILVYLDLFTSYLVTRALHTSQAAEVAKHVFQIFAEFGPPRILQSDRGKEFVNHILTELAKIYNVTVKVSTPTYHRSLGSVERLNRTLATSLRKLLGGALSTWDTILPLATLYYNAATRTLTKSTPYALYFGRAIRTFEHEGGEASQLVLDYTFDELIDSNNVESWVNDHSRHMKEWVNKHQKRLLTEIYPETAEVIKAKRAKSAEYFSAKHKIVTKPLTLGTRVLALDPTQESKHDPTWVGPYRVTEIKETGSYIVTDDLGQSLHRALPQLKVIPEDTDEAHDDNTYVLEKIIRHRTQKGQKRYLVKWVGWPHSANTWEPEESFNDMNVITRYWKSKAPPRQSRKRPVKQQKKHT